MPALSPTMKEGKILKWFVKEGDKVVPGDAIAEVETDKATMTFEVQEKGFIAKINTSTDFIAIGDPVAVITNSA
jgi:pyruvate/2-oxoglutarate dehydrogenase complex dihydrolipoamide acyltransferase (E2) component